MPVCTEPFAGAKSLAWFPGGGVAASHCSVGVTPTVQNRYGQPKWRGISEKSSEAVHR